MVDGWGSASGGWIGCNADEYGCSWLLLLWLSVTIAYAIWPIVPNWQQSIAVNQTMRSVENWTMANEKQTIIFSFIYQTSIHSVVNSHENCYCYQSILGMNENLSWCSQCHSIHRSSTCQCHEPYDSFLICERTAHQDHCSSQDSWYRTIYPTDVPWLTVDSMLTFGCCHSDWTMNPVRREVYAMIFPSESERFD